MLQRPELTLEAARDLILSRPAPVLMLDTCGLLDVVRAPMRPKSGGAQPAVDIAEAAERHPPDVYLVVPQLVVEEWDRNYARTCKELQDHIDGTRAHVAALGAACRVFSIAPPEEVSSGVELLKESLPRLATRLFDATIVLALDGACDDRAATRAGLLRPPARAGGFPNDCVVVEHCVGLAAKLQEAGLTSPRVFASSNTNDYYERGRLHPKLALYFAPVGLEFASNLAEARRRLWSPP